LIVVGVKAVTSFNNHRQQHDYGGRSQSNQHQLAALQKYNNGYDIEMATVTWGEASSTIE